VRNAVLALVLAGIALAVGLGLAAGLDIAAVVILGTLIAAGVLAVAVARRSESGAIAPASCSECGGLLSPNSPYCKHCGALTKPR
jgi:hypothetical protein